MSKRNSWILGVAFVGATLAAPASVAGQITTDAIQAEANHLHDAAMTLAAGNSMEVGAIVQKHGEAARLRLIDDPRAVECTRVQAALLHLDGQVAEAQAELERAGYLAISMGDFFNAAISFVDAALVAEEAGRRGDAVRLAETAYHLSMNPTVDDNGQARIQRRLPVGFSAR